jgi:hypothetical protein
MIGKAIVNWDIANRSTLVVIAEVVPSALQQTKEKLPKLHNANHSILQDQVLMEVTLGSTEIAVKLFK